MGQEAVRFQVLNSRGMYVAEYNNRPEAQAHVERMRAAGSYGYHVIPPEGGYPRLSDSDLEQTDIGPEDDE